MVCEQNGCLLFGSENVFGLFPPPFLCVLLQGRSYAGPLAPPSGCVPCLLLPDGDSSHVGVHLPLARPWPPVPALSSDCGPQHGSLRAANNFQTEISGLLLSLDAALLHFVASHNNANPVLLCRPQPPQPELLWGEDALGVLSAVHFCSVCHFSLCEDVWSGRARDRPPVQDQAPRPPLVVGGQRLEKCGPRCHGCFRILFYCLVATAGPRHCPRPGTVPLVWGLPFFSSELHLLISNSLGWMATIAWRTSLHLHMIAGKPADLTAFCRSDCAPSWFFTLSVLPSEGF